MTLSREDNLFSTYKSLKDILPKDSQFTTIRKKKISPKQSKILFVSIPCLFMETSNYKFVSLGTLRKKGTLGNGYIIIIFTKDNSPSPRKWEPKITHIWR